MANMIIRMSQVAGLPKFQDEIAQQQRNAPLLLRAETPSIQPHIVQPQPQPQRHCCHAVITVLVLGLLAALTAAAGGYLIYSGGLTNLSSFIPGIILSAGGLIFIIWAVALACRSKSRVIPQPDVPKPLQTETPLPPASAPIATQIFLAPEAVCSALEEERCSLALCINALSNLESEQFKAVVLHVASTYYPLKAPLSETQKKVLDAIASHPQKLVWEGECALTTALITELLMRIDPQSYDHSKELLTKYMRALGKPTQASVGALARHPKVFAELVQAQDAKDYLAIQLDVCKKMNLNGKQDYFSKLNLPEVIQKVVEDFIIDASQRGEMPDPFANFCILQSPAVAATLNKKSTQINAGLISQLFQKMTLSNKQVFIRALTLPPNFIQSHLNWCKEPLNDEELTVFAEYPEVMAEGFCMEHQLLDAATVNKLFEKMTKPDAFINKVRGNEHGEVKENKLVGWVKRTSKIVKDKILEQKTDFQRLLLIRAQYFQDRVHRECMNDHIFQAERDKFTSHFQMLCREETIKAPFLLSLLEQFPTAEKFKSLLKSLDDNSFGKLCVQVLRDIERTKEEALNNYSLSKKSLIVAFSKDKRYTTIKKNSTPSPTFTRFESLAESWSKTTSN